MKEKEQVENPDMRTVCTAVSETVHQEAEEQLEDYQKEVYSLLEDSYEALCRLAAMRRENKVSNSRVTSVAREVKELLKVMSVYVL